MRVNFPEMKRINHNNLYLYQKMSDDSISLLRQLVLILMASHFLFSLILLLLYYREKIFRRNQLMEGYAIYKVIPQKVVEYVAGYYASYCQKIRS